MKLNNAAGPAEDYVLGVATAPANRKRTRALTYVGRSYLGSDADFRAFAQMVTDQDRPIVESLARRSFLPTSQPRCTSRTPTSARWKTGDGWSR